MEAVGRDSGRMPSLPSWSHRRDKTGRSPYSISSSSSGTIISTARTSTGSYLSSISTDAAMRLDLEIHGGDEDLFLWEEKEEFFPTKSLEQDVFDLDLPLDEDMPLIEMGEEDTKFVRPINVSCREMDEQKKKMKHIKSMVQKFFAAPSANCIGDMSVLKRWLKELGVGSVLYVDPDAFKWNIEHMSWVQALAKIFEAMRLTTSLFPVRRSVGLANIYEEELEAESGKQPSKRDQFQIDQFFKETMLKMLDFLDVIASEALVKGVPERHLKLCALLRVHGALCNVLSDILSPSAETERVESEVVHLMLMKEDKTREAIWSILEDIRTEPMEDPSDTQSPQQSSGVHKITQSVVRHITFLVAHYSNLAPIVTEAARLGKYAPPFGDLSPCNSMIMNMTTFLEEQLVNMSESFSDQGLKFLFLLNNSHFMWERLHMPLKDLFDEVFFAKIKGYEERYLQVSWLPVLSCLFNPAPLCFGKNYSQLSKFESEFEKAYTTQKLWKVPDPMLRKSLRTAITEKIVTGYTKYLEENIVTITTPKFTSKVLEEMLQQLFEG